LEGWQNCKGVGESMVNNRQQETLFTRYLTAKDEPLASKCIVDVISKIMAYYLKFSKPSMRDRSKGWLVNNEALSKKKRNKRTEFRRHRHPRISAEEI